MNINIEGISGVTNTEKDSIERCVRQISTTVKETVPFLRDMGVENPLSYSNNPAEQDMYLSDLTSQIEEWDERVEVESADFINDNEVRVVIANGESE